MAITPEQKAKLAKVFGTPGQGNSKLSQFYKILNDKAYRAQYMKDRAAAKGSTGFVPGTAPQVARPPVAPMMDDPNRTTYSRGGKVNRKMGVSDKLVRRAASATPGAKTKAPPFKKANGKPNPFAKTGKGGKPPVKGKANPFAKGNPFANKGKGKSKTKPFKKFS